MKKNFIVSCLVILLTVGLCASVMAGGHSRKASKKVGILLVAFGSSIPSAQVSFENIDKNVKKTYPAIPVRWAYTSTIIRKKLARQGKHLDSPEVALAKMQDEGFTHVAVQSLHTIGGAEYHELRRTVSAFTMMGVAVKSKTADMTITIDEADVVVELPVQAPPVKKSRPKKTSKPLSTL